MSGSPELFLARRGRRVWTCPIKGTRPAGAGAARELARSAKDAAEHVMIVDLERNDLSRICEPGSVRWPELMATRALAGVEHMVSTVEGTLRDGVGLAELLAATFPGGSITGAPKIAAVDLIAEIEPVGRGASMGALGRVYGNGDLDLALTIRTFAIAEGQIHLWVGGGVVWDSSSEAEIAESWVKADPLLRAIGAPRVEPAPRRAVDGGAAARGRSPMSAGGLLAVAVSGRGLVDPGEPVLAPDDEGFTRGRAAFETMRVYDGRPFRLAQHLARLQGSAERIGLERPDVDEFESLAGARARAGGGARGGAPALLVAGAAGRRAPRDRARRPDPGLDRGCARSRVSASSRCCTRAVRRRGFSPPRSRRATPSPWRPSPRPRRAARTMPCSSTPTGSCSRGR